LKKVVDRNARRDEDVKDTAGAERQYQGAPAVATVEESFPKIKGET
jgi:hypothetical protein